ncbi:MAG TPA: class I SAM-dependent methyltransferase [Caulobacteraceae bacterium]|jgi:SAM-dependent methyltransferase|nr:class I SAM-dependent methyltransferase [Caulobacteraceae bacterium]
MQPPPIRQDEIDARIAGHLDELLALWQAEQGEAKARDLDLIAAALPLAGDQPLRVLDLCCGPGDVGRAVQRRFSNAHVDGVDRDPFLTSICRGVNGRSGARGETFVRDLEDADWHSPLSPPYDAAVVANALHWFTPKRVGEIATDVLRLLRAGGAFIVVEPTRADTPFRAGFEAWTVTQPPRYRRENWERFWSRANQLLAYDHTELLGSRLSGGLDEGSVANWIGLLIEAGFAAPDVLWRDADEVMLGAIKY